MMLKYIKKKIQFNKATPRIAGVREEGAEPLSASKKSVIEMLHIYKLPAIFT